MEPYLPYVIAVFIAALGGAFRGFAGFGSGLLMAPLLTLLFEPTVAIPVLILLSLMGSVRLVPEVWRQADRRRVASVGIPAILAIPVGVAAVAYFEADVVRRAVSALVLVMVVMLGTGVRFPGAERLTVLGPVGFVSGWLSGIGGVGGPPVVLAFLSIDADPSATRADLIVYFAIVQIVTFVSFLATGHVGSAQLTLFAVMGPIFFLAIHLGARTFGKRDGRGYRNIALGFLAAVAFTGLVWP